MKFYVFLVISLFVSSCQLDLDKTNSVEKIPAFDIEIPQNITLNKDHTISFKYALTNGCYSFYDVERTLLNDNTLIVTVFAEVADSEVCTQEYSEQTYSFNFKPTLAQTYHLKFWTGIKNGIDQYEEFEIVVE